MKYGFYKMKLSIYTINSSIFGKIGENLLKNITVYAEMDSNVLNF